MRRILIITIVVALLTLGAVYLYLNKTEEKQLKEAEKVEQMVMTYFSKYHIPSHAIIGPEIVYPKPMPKSSLPKDIITDINQINGYVTKKDIPADTHIVLSQLYEGRKRLSYLIPDGKLALAVRVNEVIAVSHLIQPGDFVDVATTFTDRSAGEDISKIVVQCVKVISIGQDYEIKKTNDNKPPEKVAYTVAVLVVTPQESEKLTLSEERGKLRLLLRNPEQSQKIETTGVTLKQLAGNKTAKPAVKKKITAPAPVVKQAVPVPQKKEGKKIQIFKGTRVDEVEIEE